MESELKEINFLSWDKFKTRELLVEPNLLGYFHEFNYNGSLIRVELPSSDNLDKDEKYNEYNETLYVRGYSTLDGNPTQVEIMSVDVTVCRNEKISIPAQVLDVPPNAYKLFSENSQRNLNETTEKYSMIAKKAFDLWLRTLRWKCNRGFIAQPEIIGSESGWSTYLLEADTMKRFWIGKSIEKLYISKPIALPEWESVERALKNEETPPVYYDLFFDAQEHFRNENYPRMIVDAAVACETYLRTLINQELPKELNAALRKYIDDANIRQVLEHFIVEVLSEDGKKHFDKIKFELHKLFDARNKILHSGHVEDITEDKCKKFIDAAKKLIDGCFFACYL